MLDMGGLIAVNQLSPGNSNADVFQGEDSCFMLITLALQSYCKLGERCLSSVDITMKSRSITCIYCAGREYM